MLRAFAVDLVAPSVCGVLVALGFAPFAYYPLALFGLTGVLALWWSASAVAGARRGFVFGLAYFGLGMYWPFVSIHSFGHAPAWLAGVLTALLVIYMALYPMLVGLLAAVMRRWPRPVWALLLVPAAWLGAELVRGWLGTGIPWLSLGYSLIDSPAAALAPIAGVYSLSTALVFGAGVLCLLFAGSLIGRAIAVVLIAVTPVVLWWLPPPAHWTHPRGAPVSVDIIQGNFGQAIKSKPETLAPTLMRYQRLTERSKANIVVWPETAMPVPAGEIEPYLHRIAAHARQRDQTVLAGALVAHGRSYYNAVLTLGAGSGYYYKRHLVPFGEYFPVPAFIKRWMDGVHMKYGSLAFGPKQQPLITAHGATLGTSICFEDLFPREIARSLPAAGVLVNVTNDAWFAHTPAAAQHLRIARMRALEVGRPLLRAANTGISAIIDYAGRVRQRTPQFKIAQLHTGRIVPRGGTTPYVETGNAPLWMGAGALVLIGLMGAGVSRRVITHRLPARRL